MGCFYGAPRIASVSDKTKFDFYKKTEFSYKKHLGALINDIFRLSPTIIYVLVISKI
jgi:hypothetical protein